jgi:hypothetical protein
MSVRNELIAGLRRLLPTLREKHGVETLSIFGSAARGDDVSGSDVDVLLTFRKDFPATLMTLGAITTLLEDGLGRRVDVVEDHVHLRPSFRREIERDLYRVA